MTTTAIRLDACSQQEIRSIESGSASPQGGTHGSAHGPSIKQVTTPQRAAPPLYPANALSCQVIGGNQRKSGCQSRTSRAAFVTAPMVRNEAVSTIIARASRRAPRLANRPLLGSSINSKSILCASPRMRRMIFCGRKSHGVAEQPRHIGLPLGLQARRAGLTRKQRQGIGVAVGFVRQSSRNSRANSVQTFSIVSSTQASKAAPVARRPLVTGGGQIGHQEIGDDGADIEPHRSVEREFRDRSPRSSLPSP